MPQEWSFKISIIILEYLIMTETLKKTHGNRKIYNSVTALNLIRRAIGFTILMALTEGWWLAIWPFWKVTVECGRTRQVIGVGFRSFSFVKATHTQYV